MTKVSQITRSYMQLYVKTKCWYYSKMTFKFGAKLLHFLSLLKSILLLISLVYLKLMERLLSISVRRQWIYISAQKKCMAGWNELFQSIYEYLLRDSATLQRRNCLHLLSFSTVDSNSHFYTFILFSAMHLFKEQ